MGQSSARPRRSTSPRSRSSSPPRSRRGRCSSRSASSSSSEVHPEPAAEPSPPAASTLGFSSLSERFDTRSDKTKPSLLGCGSYSHLVYQFKSVVLCQIMSDYEKDYKFEDPGFRSSRRCSPHSRSRSPRGLRK